MKKIIAAGLFGLSLSASGLAMAEPVKIGMITTLSGGGAGLGIDTRDGFMLAIEQAGNDEIEVVIEDDGQKPELAVQIAAKSPLAVQGTKAVMLHARDHAVGEGLEFVAHVNAARLASDDLGEATAAMFERRKPVFSKL